MGLGRLGRLIEYIPLSVTLGFTSGIGITIATMQVKDFFGLHMEEVPENYVGKVAALAQSLPTINFSDTLIATVTLMVLILWPRLKLKLPGHLPALVAGTAVMGLLSLFDHQVATIGSRFGYLLADGTQGHGIPYSAAVCPSLAPSSCQRARVCPELGHSLCTTAGGLFDGHVRGD